MLPLLRASTLINWCFIRPKFCEEAVVVTCQWSFCCISPSNNSLSPTCLLGISDVTLLMKTVVTTPPPWPLPLTQALELTF